MWNRQKYHKARKGKVRDKEMREKRVTTQGVLCWAGPMTCGICECINKTQTIMMGSLHLLQVTIPCPAHPEGVITNFPYDMR